MSKANVPSVFCTELCSQTTPTTENHTSSNGEDIRKILPGKDIPKSPNLLSISTIAKFNPKEKKYFEPQVPDKSGSYDFSCMGSKEYLECYYGVPAKPFSPSNKSSETELPSSSPATGMNFCGHKDLSPSTAADRIRQLSPQTKRHTISDSEETPRHFLEPLTQKYFQPQVSESIYASEIIINSNEYYVGDEGTSEKAASPITENSSTKAKSPYSVPSKCNETDPSVLLNENGPENFPSRITEYLNEQKKNIAHFKSKICDFLQHQIEAIKNGNMFVENITEYGNFFDSSIFLSQDDLAEMENSNDKVHLKNVLEHNASVIKYLAERNLQLSIFSNHAKSWLEKASAETKEHSKLVETKTTAENKSTSTETAGEVNDFTLHYQNESKDKRKVADSSTMTSPDISEEGSNSQKKSRVIKESRNNKQSLGQDKKIFRVCNVSTMTDSAIKMKNSVDQHRKHSLSAESSAEMFSSCDKNGHKLNKTCDSSTMTNHASKRKTKPTDSHSNKGETSGNTVTLHSCDKNSRNVKCCNSSTMTEVRKTRCRERTRETSVCIRVTQNEPISCSQDENTPKKCTTSTMRSSISDFENIVDRALSALVEVKPVTEDSEKTSSTLREFVVRCCQTTEEIVENQSLVTEELGNGLNASMDSSSNEEKIQFSANVSVHNFKGYESARPNSSTNSLRRNSMSEGIKVCEVENDLKHRKKSKSYSCKCLRRDCSSRVEKVGDTSSTSVDGSNKDKEVYNCSRNIEMYGLSTPNLSFATIDYLTRHGLVNTSSKTRSSPNEKK